MYTHPLWSPFLMLFCTNFIPDTMFFFDCAVMKNKNKNFRLCSSYCSWTSLVLWNLYAENTMNFMIKNSSEMFSVANDSQDWSWDKVYQNQFLMHLNLSFFQMLNSKIVALNFYKFFFITYEIHMPRLGTCH